MKKQRCKISQMFSSVSPDLEVLVLSGDLGQSVWGRTRRLNALRFGRSLGRCDSQNLFLAAQVRKTLPLKMRLQVFLYMLGRQQKGRGQKQPHPFNLQRNLSKRGANNSLNGPQTRERSFRVAPTIPIKKVPKSMMEAGSGTDVCEKPSKT